MCSAHTISIAQLTVLQISLMNIKNFSPKKTKKKTKRMRKKQSPDIDIHTCTYTHMDTYTYVQYCTYTDYLNLQNWQIFLPPTGTCYLACKIFFFFVFIVHLHHVHVLIKYSVQFTLTCFLFGQTPEDNKNCDFHNLISFYIHLQN